MKTLKDTINESFVNESNNAYVSDNNDILKIMKSKYGISERNIGYIMFSEFEFTEEFKHVKSDQEYATAFHKFLKDKKYI